MGEFLQKLLRERSGSIKIKSQALNPMVWFCGVLVAAGTGLLLFGLGLAQVFGALLISIATGSFLVAFWHFARSDPDRLGTEAFVFNKELLHFAQTAKNPEILQHLQELVADEAAPAKKLRAADRDTPGGEDP